MGSLFISLCPHANCDHLLPTHLLGLETCLGCGFQSPRVVGRLLPVEACRCLSEADPGFLFLPRALRCGGLVGDALPLLLQSEPSHAVRWFKGDFGDVFKSIPIIVLKHSNYRMDI